MASKLLILLISFLLISFVSGHNITKILGQFPDYSSFNSLITQTQLAAEVNSQRIITVLVASNSVTSSIAKNQPAYVLSRILMLHVLLDYYDTNKLSQLKNRTNTVRTLFDTTGHTTGKNGYLNITGSSGNVIIASAEPGARYDAHTIKVVSSQPYNISVIEISNLIIPPAIGANHTAAPAPSQRGTPSPSTPAADAPGTGSAQDAADALNPKADSGDKASAVTRSIVDVAVFGVGMGVAAFLGAF